MVISAPLKYIEEDKRLSFLPIPKQRQALFDHYTKQIDVRWRAEEIKLSEDRLVYTTLPQPVQHFIKYGLAVFAQFDKIVNVNIADSFEREIDIPEAKIILHEQMAMEDIHAHTYSMQIIEILPNDKERNTILNAIQNIPTLARLHKWLLSYSNASFADRIIAAACIEGLIFVTVFCFIYWVDINYLMPGLAQANELIARDENNHLTSLTMFYDLIRVEHQCTEVRVHEIIAGAVEIGENYIREALVEDLNGMNITMLSEYLKYSADVLCLKFGYGRIFNATQPFKFMEKINIKNKTNFFERHNTNYEEKNNAINIDDSNTLMNYDI